MRNADKVMTALKEAFSESRIENIYYPEKKEECIYCNGTYIASFDEKFWQADFDNIEIKIKAPLKHIKEFINGAVGYEIVRAAVERGLSEWQEESQRNN